MGIKFRGLQIDPKDPRAGGRMCIAMLTKYCSINILTQTLEIDMPKTEKYKSEIKWILIKHGATGYGEMKQKMLKEFQSYAFVFDEERFKVALKQLVFLEKFVSLDEGYYKFKPKKVVSGNRD